MLWPGNPERMTTTIDRDRPLRAIGLICSLKPSPAPSSSALIVEQLFEQLEHAGVQCEAVRCVDYSVSPGVQTDMGPGDEWPAILDKIVAADIIVMSTPTWVGHMSSVAQRVLERLDAELSQTDESGRPRQVGKVALAAVVGNEDGAHKIVADLFQALNDIGFTIAAQGCTYWNDEAMGSRDFNDLDDTPPAVAATTATAARNAVHLAHLLRQHPYPPYS